jgi:hypothetical protein
MAMSYEQRLIDRPDSHSYACDREGGTRRCIAHLVDCVKTSDCQLLALPKTLQQYSVSGVEEDWQIRSTPLQLQQSIGSLQERK